MDTDRYSNSWPLVELASLPPSVRSAINEIESVAGPVRVVRWSERYVAVAVDIRVDLPTRGPVDDLDIRRVEPTLVLLDTRDYPFDAPEARIDRCSFPTDKVPHLNPVRSGQPSWMCLHRGSFEDWFAEHSVRELVERIRGWYRDAARGRLMRDGDVFEPTRLEISKRVMVFSARTLSRVVFRRWARSQVAGYGFTFARVGGDALKHTGWDSSLAVSLWPFLEPDTDPKLIEIADELNAVTNKIESIPRATFAVCAWTSATPVPTYFGRLPSTYGELLTFADTLGIPLRDAIDEIRRKGAQLLKGIPVLLGIKRPRPLQGSGSDLEWLCFAIATSDDPSETDSVITLGHREPLTPTFARTLSVANDVTGLARPMVVGCGAVGSKLSLHLAKAGFVAQHLVDHALLTPHHMVRHGLVGDQLGRTKAEALRDVIVGLYPGQPELGVQSTTGTCADVLADPSKLEGCTMLIDATASLAVQNQLASAQLPAGLRVCRVGIADQGRLGVMAYEGGARNPRLDDLQAHLYDMGRSDAVISEWLRSHARDQPAFEDIGLGLGCSSATLRIADDVVSHHAAAFSRALRRLGGQNRGHLVLVNERDADSSTKVITVPPVKVLDVDGGEHWSVRVSANAMTSMRSALGEHGLRETGGLLVGIVNMKRRIVYVTHALEPSRDSRGTRVRFVRGVDGYPEAITDIERRTGRMLGYVGEWHTHPEGSTSPSPIDRVALAEIQQRLDPAGIPGVIVIVGPQSTTAAMHSQ